MFLLIISSLSQNYWYWCGLGKVHWQKKKKLYSLISYKKNIYNLYNINLIFVSPLPSLFRLLFICSDLTLKWNNIPGWFQWYFQVTFFFHRVSVFGVYLTVLLFQKLYRSANLFSIVPLYCAHLTTRKRKEGGGREWACPLSLFLPSWRKKSFLVAAESHNEWTASTVF